MTACPQTTRYLTSYRLKMFNSASKSELIGTTGAARMRVDHQLPRGLENRRWTQALPVLDVKLSIHVLELAVLLHHECRFFRLRHDPHFISDALHLAITPRAGSSHFRCRRDRLSQFQICSMHKPTASRATAAANHESTTEGLHRRVS